MFVVKVLVDNELTDYKAFSEREPAFARFNSGTRQTFRGEFETIAVYEVEGTDNARIAVHAVKAGKDSISANKVSLLAFEESDKRTIAKLSADFIVDL